jgi:hypothetical protein
MREAKEKQVTEMQTLASILPDHDRFYGRCRTPFGTIAPQKSIAEPNPSRKKHWRSCRQ